MASNDILESQNQLRLQNIGCDVIFEIGSKSFPAHRVVLMARMEYFRNMFTADMREKKELTVQFDPLIIDPDFFGDVLNYVYTSKIDFILENLRPVFKAADYFCFDELTNKVKEYMFDTIGVENAILYRSIIVEFNLEDGCEEFIIDNVSSDVIKSQLIPTLSLEELENFNHKLKEKSMFEDMFNYSVEWILNDKDNRSEMLSELMKNIPLESLSFQFIHQNVSKHEIVLNDNDCLKLLFKTVLTISAPFHSQNISKRRETQMESMYVIAGRDRKILSLISKYNSVTRKWTTITFMPSERVNFDCAVIGPKIYVCGGWNRRLEMNELTVFDTQTRTWTQLTPMNHARELCAATALNGQIYVAGGFDRVDRLSVVEQYNVQTNRWKEVAPMIIERSALELVALNGFLYAIGGYSGWYRLDIVERYDPRSGQWTRMNNTNNEYSSFGSAVWNGTIYIVGDDNCEVYSPEYDEWTEIPAPARCEFGRRLAVYNDKLYAIGGCEGDVSDSIGRKTVEVFDSQSRVWRKEPDMDVARTHHQVAVVKS